MYKPMLTVMVGLSGSGKSTIAKTELADENTVIVSSDAILEKKKNVIADATNLTMKSRRAILMTVNGLDIVKRCYIVPKPYECCLEDNRHREHPVPDEVITKQRMKFQVPFMEEGWDIIKINDRFEQCNLCLVEGFDQKNPHHTLDLYHHCSKAFLLFIDKDNISATYGFGAYMHDLGKMYCQTFDENGIAHYFGHASISGYELISHEPGPYILESAFLANYHMLPFDWKTEKAHEKWKKCFGEEKYNVLMAFHECDLAAR